MDKIFTTFTPLPDKKTLDMNDNSSTSSFFTDLSTIQNPAQVQEYSLEELQQLADNIRSTLIQNVTKTGGHLASSLGVVDLTVAMLSVFNPNVDKLIWDVGHQAYAYKLLTGRAKNFHTLRQYNGISGFPSIEESPYDHFGVGHSSTSISAALGFAAARDLANESHHVVSVIGDGSLTGGMVYEAFNNAGAKNKPLIVILNDNEMSITKNVGALSLFMSRNLSSRWARRVKKEIEGFLQSIPSIGDDLHEIARRSKHSFKNFFTPGILFEALHFNYIGAVDGHNIAELQKVLHLAASQDSPVLVHVLTKKGYGYQPALDDPENFHSVNAVKPVHPPASVEVSSAPSYSSIFGETLCQLARKDTSIIAITAAMPCGTGLKKFAAEFPNRFFDVGICEQHAVTYAAALATQGLKPFVAIYSTFLQRAYDQIVHDVCLQNLPVTFCIDRAGVVGEDGATHQGAFDISFLRHIPNMTFLAPADEVELAQGLYTASQGKTPFAIRYPRGAATGEIATDGSGVIPLELLPIGRAQEIIRNRGGIAILALGHTVPPAYIAANNLIAKNHLVSLFNARWISPLPEKDIKDIFLSYDTIFIVEEHSLAGGFSSAVVEYAVDNNLLTGQKLHRHGLPHRFIKHGASDIIRRELQLDAQGIEKIALSLLQNKR